MEQEEILEEQEQAQGRRAKEEQDRSHGGTTSTSQYEQLQVARILEKLTERLDKPPQQRTVSAPSSLKMPSLQLPTIRRTGNNEVTTRAYYQWKIALSTVLSLHGVGPDAILIHYATTPKLLPEEFTTIMANSESLQQAIKSLDSLFAPLVSIRPELIRGMTDLPPLVNASEKTRVFRITTVLRLLDEFIKFFGTSPHRDLSRQDVLVILHNFYGSQESRAELVKEVTHMELAKQRGTMYAESLKDYFTRTRTVLVDVISALQLVGKTEHSGKARSSAARARLEGKESLREEEKANGKNPTCLLCSSSKHLTYGCSDQLKLIREGKKKLDKKICSSCLGPLSKPHGDNCAIKRSFRDGVYILTDFKCNKGCGVHNRLCNCQAGPTQKVDPDQSKPQRSAATRAVEIQEEGEDMPRLLSAANAVNKDGEVVFLSENLRLLGKDGSTQLCVCSFDSHGSKHFLSGKLSDNFLHSKEQHKRFQIDTVTGTEESKREIFDIRLLTLKGVLHLEAVEASWVDGAEEPQLNTEEADRHGIALPVTEDHSGAPLPRLILSASEIQLHPREVPCPAELRALHPKINLFRSKLSNQLLCGGQLGVKDVQ